MEIRPVLIHADKQADTQTDKHDEAKCHISQFWGGA
jgi:hypothetical protein